MSIYMIPLALIIIAIVIMIPQLILRSFYDLTIKKSIIVRVIISLVYLSVPFILLIIVAIYDKINIFKLFVSFIKEYSQCYQEYNVKDLMKLLEGDMGIYNHSLMLSIIFCFPQFTLVIPGFLYEKFENYAKVSEEVTLTSHKGKIDDNGNISIWSESSKEIRYPLLWKTIIAIILAVIIFGFILTAIMQYISLVYMMGIIIVFDIFLLIFVNKD